MFFRLLVFGMFFDFYDDLVFSFMIIIKVKENKGCKVFGIE